MVRLRDFMQFCLRVAHHEGWLDNMTRICSALSREQEATAIAGNTLREAIMLWIGSNANDLTEAKEIPASRFLKEYLRITCEREHLGQLPYTTGKGCFEAIQQMSSLYKKEFGLTARFDSTRKVHVVRVAPTPEQRSVCVKEVRSRNRGIEKTFDDVMGNELTTERVN